MNFDPQHHFLKLIAAVVFSRARRIGMLLGFLILIGHIGRADQAYANPTPVEESSPEISASPIELLQWAKDKTDTRRMQKARAVLDRKGPSSLAEFDALLQATKDRTDPELQADAAKALGKVESGAINLAPEYRKLLKEKDRDLKIAGISGAARLKDRGSKKLLIELLSDRAVGAAASQALGAIGDDDVVPEMIARAGETEGKSMWGLGRFGRKGLVSVLEAYRKPITSPNEKKAYLLKIQFAKDPAAKDLLLQLVNDKDDKLRAAALQGLGWMGDDSIVDILVKQVDDPSSEVSDGALMALNTLQMDKAFRALEHLLLHHKNSSVRSSVVAGLSYYGEESNIPALQEALDRDPSSEVREDAKLAIEKIRRGRNTGNRNRR